MGRNLGKLSTSNCQRFGKICIIFDPGNQAPDVVSNDNRLVVPAFHPNLLNLQQYVVLRKVVSPVEAFWHIDNLPRGDEDIAQWLSYKGDIDKQ